MTFNRKTSFKEGEENHLKAVGIATGISVLDEITFRYQTQKWGKPARLVLKELSNKLATQPKTITVEAEVQDGMGGACLDARNVVRFGLTGNGRLIDNLGTSTSARKLELYNGRAIISLQREGEVVVSVSSEGLPTAFLRLE